jgi:hypothetical protein
MSSKRYSNPHESKSQKFWRSFLAFTLFLVLSLLALSIAIRAVFINPQSIVKVFTDDNYTYSLYEDVSGYARDLCRSASIPEDSADSAVTFDKIYEIQKAYSAGMLGTDEQYTLTTYQDDIDNLCDELKREIAETVKNRDLKISQGIEEPEEEFTRLFREYLESRVEIPLMDRLPNILTIARTLDLIAIITLAVMAVLLIFIVPSIGNKLYRALRWVAYAFMGSGIFNLLLVLGVQCIKLFKHLVLYPVYFSDALMRYINNCLLSVTASSGVLFACALTVACIVWKIKRDKNN